MRAVALLGLALGGMAAVAPAASAEGEVTVTWPEVTSFNPDTTEYVVDIQSDGPWTYRVTGWEDYWGTDHGLFVDQDVPTPGRHAITFSDDAGALIALNLYRCDESGSSCSWVSTSPQLHVWRALDFSVDSYERGPSTPVVLGFPENEPRPDHVDATWQVLDRTGATVATGSMEDAPYVDPTLPTIGDLPGMVEGAQYQLRMQLSADVPPYGRLSGEGSGGFRWDSKPNPWVTVGMYSRRTDTFVPSDSFYPVADGVGDRLWIKSDSDALSLIDLEVRSPTGEVVLHTATAAPERRPALEWTGLASHGVPLPEGTYTATITTYDHAWNEAVLTREITLSHDVPTRTVWRDVVRPWDTRHGREVYSCAHLQVPGRRGWQGSIGYRSEGCDGIASLAATYHRVKVPRSATGTYGSVRLTVVGGAQDGRSHLMFRVPEQGRMPPWTTAAKAGAPDGSYRGAWVAKAVTVPNGRRYDPYTEWSVGTSGANSYDVKKFVVEVQYYTIGGPA